MPGTTRYSATFDRPYEEDELGPGLGSGPPVVRRPRSQSLQVESLTTNGRRFSAFLPPTPENDGQSKAAESIPTRTAGKSAVKGHNNPFQFVKVGTSPIYKKADDQQKKPEAKKPEVVKEEEQEEWKSNLDSWKSRRRKMSEDVLRRQEEIKKLEEEHETFSCQQQQPKKTKTFSEMIESRAHRGRAVSLCLFSNPLESADWIFEKGKLKSNRNNSYDPLEPSEESAESSNINSEDDNDHYNKQSTKDSQSNILKPHASNGHQPKTNGVLNSHAFASPDMNLQNSNGGYIDSGLESLSSSHRTGDIPDSGSDFSQDSGSSIDCDSPRVSGLITTGIELLEEFSTKNKTQVKTENLTNGNSAKATNHETVLTNQNHLTNSKSNKNKSQSVESENEMFVDDFEELASFKNNQTPDREKEMNGSNAAIKQNSEMKNEFSLIAEVPIEKVTEEMERLILEQLEQEERDKEMTSNKPKIAPNFVKNKNGNSLKLSEPPKEKPPPPPMFSDDTQKSIPVKRVNSTKRILREINKRRTDFLGIETSDEELLNDDTLVPPPPVLEDILRDEREHDRLRRQQIMATVSTVQETMLKDEEIAQKEREIIERLESDEKMKLAMFKAEELKIQRAEDLSAIEEAERIEQLKLERLRLENEKIEAENKMRMEEARLLQKREEQVRKQEGDGENLSSKTDSDPAKVSKSKTPPPAPPKPLKRKEVLRKERERLRLEQEALQHEREEHRRKIQLEQEQLKTVLPKTHVPEAPISRVGPPPPAKPTLPPQLTIPSSKRSSQQKEEYSQPPARNIIAAPSRKIPASKIRVSTSPVKSQKVPCIRKSEGETRYNQNHWLIQEAEMRRIAEQTERQRTQNNNNVPYHSPTRHTNNDIRHANNDYSTPQRPIAQNGAAKATNYAVPMQLYSPEQCHYGQQFVSTKVCHNDGISCHHNFDIPPAKPSRTPVEKQEQMLSVSGRKRCSHCGEELGRGAAMIIESLQLYYHIQCFLCCVCQAQLGNGSCGTDVRVRNNKLHCQNCYSNDEAGLKFSQV